MALMEALLFRRLSYMAAYAELKLETASVRLLADGSSSAEFMP